MELDIYKFLGWSIIATICGYAFSKIYYYIEPNLSFISLFVVASVSFIAAYLLIYLKTISIKKFYGTLTALLLIALSTEGLESIKELVIINTSTAIVLGVLAGISISIAIIYLFYQEEQ